MKKAKLIFFLLILNINIFSQEYSVPFDFYIYSFEEAGDLFTLFQYFDQMESGEISDYETINYFLTNGISNKSVAGLFTEAYFRETKNPSIQKIVKDYISTLDNSVNLEAILKRYDSIEEPIIHDGIETYRLIYNDELYDENIEFHNVNSIHLFDGKLAAFIPLSDWLPMTFSNKESGEEDNNQITLFTGGGTTASHIRYEMKELKIKPEIGSFHDPDNLMFELNEESVISKNNADLTVLKINSDQDSLLTFTLILYDFDEMIEYTIGYFYNISTINLNYEIFTRMKTHLLYTSFLTYIEN